MQPIFRRRAHCFALSPRMFWGLAALLALLRLALAGSQLAYTWVGGAPLDDELMFRAANSITAGQWLGGYDYLTLSKSMGFAVWLALLHALRIPYLVGGAALWLGAALLAARSFAPLWHSAARGRAAQLVLFGVLAFSPSSWAAYTLRVYRDNIFPALCLLFFAGCCGALLRARGPAKIWPWLLAAGAGLGAAVLTREDAALFLLPFAAAATLALLVLLARQKRWLRAVQLAIPYGVLAAAVLAVCSLNAAYYGLFALSDFSSGSFADAMGAMNRVAGAAQYEKTGQVTVPAAARADLYAASPELQRLSYWLEQDAQLQNDFRDPAVNDYRAGSFYWAVRRAAQYEGVYASAQTADAYWRAVADTLNTACDAGTLPSAGGQRSGTTPPIRASYIPPVLAESAKSALWALTFQACPPAETLRSIGTEADIAQWSADLHCGFNSAAQAGKDTPYYSPLQTLLQNALRGLRLIYAVALPLVFLYALYLQIRKIPNAISGQGGGRLLWWLLLGLLGMAALRCGMIAFVEVSSFGIGTSTMYLATVHPLLLLYAAVGILSEKENKTGV